MRRALGVSHLANSVPHFASAIFDNWMVADVSIKGKIAQGYQLGFLETPGKLNAPFKTGLFTSHPKLDRDLFTFYCPQSNFMSGPLRRRRAVSMSGRRAADRDRTGDVVRNAG